MTQHEAHAPQQNAPVFNNSVGGGQAQAATLKGVGFRISFITLKGAYGASAASANRITSDAVRIAVLNFAPALD
jgi:hypothetical protein